MIKQTIIVALLIGVSLNSYAMNRVEALNIITSNTYRVMTNEGFKEIKNSNGIIVYKHEPRDRQPVMVGIYGTPNNISGVSILLKFTAENYMGVSLMSADLAGSAMPEKRKEASMWVLNTIPELAGNNGGKKSFTSNNKTISINILANGTAIIGINFNSK